ncbi:unnamed protein product [Linum trigynum]|uniref:Reverse transcriptase zinc-binding domain-containing protein n=1 Tax=Linum trigynum TaxID=586398 RepID=A0AAV2FKF2_9ROSI
MCRSKHEGGMGFRRFEQFNQALLAKIGWQILNDPQSLLAQVYKGKYFPTGSFLTATARSRPSWGWQSILFGRQLLEQGLRWQIGNGRSAPMLNSNWIPQHQFDHVQINPVVLPEDGDMKVAELIVPGEGRWCENKLSRWFDPPTCKAIKAIPLPQRNIEDRLIWHATEDGVFTVKSAYHFAVLIDKRRGGWQSTVSWMDKASWIRLWEADIPPKLKVFVWQILSRVLPTTEALIERKVQVRPRCPVCWARSETLEHLFLYCPVARALWDHAGLDYLGEGLPRQTFPLFLKKLMALINQPTVFMAVVAILWRIWRSRNWVVFEGKQFDIPVLMRQFVQQYEEWVRLPRDRVCRPPQPDQGQLISDGPPRMVCRWDGATRRGSHSAGGVVLFSQTGEVGMVRGIQLPGIDSPQLVELLALREAVIWCSGLGFTDMVFEGDAKVIIEKINRGDHSDSRMGAVLEELVQYFHIHPGFSIRFIGRCNNRAAHLVARKALSLYPTMSRFFDFQTWLISRV